MAAPVAASTCCGGDVVYGEPMAAEASPAMMEGVPTEAAAPSGAIMVNNAGEEIVPGSVQVINDGSEAAESASDAIQAVDAAPAVDGI